MLVSMLLLAGYLFKQSHIAVAVHHPMVWSVAVFGFAHLIANGSAADVVLFGAFFIWALADLMSSYARDRRNSVVYPEPNWGATIGAIVVGLALWAVIAFWLHLLALRRVAAAGIDAERRERTAIGRLDGVKPKPAKR